MADVFRGLAPEQWRRPTLLVPVDPGLPRWTVAGRGYFAPVRVDEFAASRIVEAVVHGIDLAHALGSPYFATADGIATTAPILDDLLARRTTGHRPAELSDDMDWILAASGRAESSDNRLPLIG